MIKAQEEWNEIHQFLKAMSNAQLGALLKEYVEEASYGGFDGFSPRDVTGIRRMLWDLRTYYNNNKT